MCKIWLKVLRKGQLVWFYNNLFMWSEMLVTVPTVSAFWCLLMFNCFRQKKVANLIIKEKSTLYCIRLAEEGAQKVYQKKLV